MRFIAYSDNEGCEHIVHHSGLLCGGVGDCDGGFGW